LKQEFDRPTFRKWYGISQPAIILAVCLAGLNAPLLLIASSKAFGASAFAAPFCEETKQKLECYSVISLLEDLPQVVIQLYVAFQGVHVDIAVFISMLFSILNVLRVVLQKILVCCAYSSRKSIPRLMKICYTCP